MGLSSWKSLIFLVFLGIVATSSQVEAGCKLSLPAGSAKLLPTARLNQALLNSAIVGYVNVERCRKGRSQLKAVSGMRTQAASHSKWMSLSGKLSHKATGRYHRSLGARLKASGVRFRTGAENIGFVHLYRVDDRRFTIRSAKNCEFTNGSGQRISRHTYGTIAELIVRKWMESPGHRKNILNPKHKFTGAGAEIKGNAQYCGLVFLTQIYAG